MRSVAEGGRPNYKLESLAPPFAGTPIPPTNASRLQVGGQEGLATSANQACWLSGSRL